MGTERMPAAEVEISTSLVRALLAEQHPDLADLELTEVSHGWDNVMYRLGEWWTVRLPRRAMAAKLVKHEQQMLPRLAPRLPLAVPIPVRIGAPSAALGYPWGWSVTMWLSGQTAAGRPLAAPRTDAARLGDFMAALHVTAPRDAPVNESRGHHVGLLTNRFTGNAARLGENDVLDARRAVERWHELVDAVGSWRRDPVWLHGDLHLANLLVEPATPDGHGVAGWRLSGVIDWGDVCGGDPATDLAVAWSLFDRNDRRVFRDHAGAVIPIDDDTWRRAEAWALHFSVLYVLHSADSPRMGEIGRHLARALDVSPAG